MPDKYIYEPWMAPKEVQEKSKCVVGRDYPSPIVDHATIHKVRACLTDNTHISIYNE